MSKKLRTIVKEKRTLKQESKVVHQLFRKVTDQREFSDLLPNDSIVLNTLRRVSRATRSDLVKLCDLPRTTIYDALIRLKRLGAVERYPEERTKRGRPKIFYRIS
ncbi:MAG: helix-turn-helix domain-containing protein [Candidatus Heimdallarchaeota archaeon]